MNKKFLITIILIVLIGSGIFFLENNKKTIKKQESIPLKTSSQEYQLETLIDSINESFNSQAKKNGGQSNIQLRNDLSYIDQSGRKEGMNGVCAVYVYATNSLEWLKEYPEFKFGDDFILNKYYKAKSERGYSLFSEQKNISCDIEYSKNSESICCVYYK